MSDKSRGEKLDIPRMFGRVSSRYDLLNRIMTFGQDRRWRREVAWRGNASQEVWTLDLGAGTGDLALEVRRLQPHIPIVAVDVSRRMLSLAQTKPRSETIAWVIADVERLPFADASMGNTLSAFLIRNVLDIETVLTEQFRVLRPNGSMVCLDTTPPRSNILKPLMLFYYSRIIPLIGKLLAGDGRAYKYLADSTIQFLDYSTRSLDAVAIHSARKG
jgi:demethylmenaquinone methyltransferase/2-methoxy-6-polyprenyl-1,4-benzoquinol methylase